MAALRPWLWPFVLGALLLLGLAFAFWPRAVAVDIATLREGPMTVTIEDDGVTRVKEVYVLSAPIAGKLLRIESKAGDTIEAQKTVIATIEPSAPAFRDVRAQRELEFTVSAARAARDLAAGSVRAREAELKLGRQERERVRPLVARGVLPRARLDAAEAAVATQEAVLATAQAAFRQREFEVKTAEASLIIPSDDGGSSGRRFAIRAPIDGRVLRVVNESETVVQAGQPLVEVGDPSNLEVVVDLLSTEAVKVSPGDRVWIMRWGGEGVLNAKVRRVEPFGVTKISSLGIEEQRVNVIIDLTDPRSRWQRLGHGYQIDAAIVRWQSARALQVPIGALFRHGEDWAVFRVEQDVARLTPVKIDHMNDESAEVVGGLEAGDRVISHPGERVADGVRVAARNDPQ
jgi:HlyD family secretion protein